MLAGLTWLLVFQSAGELIARLLHLPVPGPVIGMILLFIALRIRHGIPPVLDLTAGHLQKHLSLLFVPAGVGVITYGTLLAREWGAIALALVASTILSIAATALGMTWLVQRGRRAREDTADGGA
jgi:holin-like protein